METCVSSRRSSHPRSCAAAFADTVTAGWTTASGDETQSARGARLLAASAGQPDPRRARRQPLGPDRSRAAFDRLGWSRPMPGSRWSRSSSGKAIGGCTSGCRAARTGCCGPWSRLGAAPGGHQPLHDPGCRHASLDLARGDRRPRDAPVRAGHGALRGRRPRRRHHPRLRDGVPAARLGKRSAAQRAHGTGAPRRPSSKASDAKSIRISSSTTSTRSRTSSISAATRRRGSSGR